ncbi:hypothetical protein FJY90_07910 [Candidatus Gottesmanbacteria bacterium]|nr:hypothetical protein [Candidatus Gottesmanbacteria bacterium]
MADHHQQSPPPTEETDESAQPAEKPTTPEEVYRQQQQNLYEEAPEIQQIGFTIQLAGGIFFLKAHSYTTVSDAFKTLSDPKLVENLLDFEHPEKLTTVQEAINISDKELRKKGNIRRGYAQTDLFFLHSKLTPDQQRRAIYSTALARRLHKSINAREVEIKTQGYIQRFGLTEEGATKFRKKLSEELKTGKDLDDCLVGEAKKASRQQHKEFSEKELRAELRQQRQMVVDEHKDRIARTEETINKFQDLNQPVPQAQQLRDGIKYTEQGIVPQAGPLTEEKLAGGFPEGVYPDEIMDRSLETTQTVQPAQVLHPQVPTPTQPAAALPAKPSIGPKRRFRRLSIPDFFAAARNRIISTLGLNILQDKIRAGAASIAKKFAFVLGVRAVIRRFFRNRVAGSLRFLRNIGLRRFLTFSRWKAAVAIGSKLFSAGKLLLGLGTGGIGLAAFLGIEIAKKLPLVGGVVSGVETYLFGLVKDLIIVIIMIACLPILFMIFARSDKIKPFSTTTAQNAISLPRENAYNWNQFEKEFLSQANSNNKPYLSWQQFEKENIIPAEKYLSQNQE